jgi:hypothetical protein
VIQLRSALADVALAALKTEIEVDPVVLYIRTGSAPIDTSEADTGTVLATLNLSSPIFNAPSLGSMAYTGTWEDLSADNTGTAGHWRLAVDGTIYLQGTCSLSGDGGDLILSTLSFTTGDSVTIDSFTLSLPV